MRRLVTAGLALVAVSVAAQSPMYSDYPWGLVQNGVDQGPVWNVNCISPGLACSVDGGNGTISVNVAGGGGALADAGFITWYADPGLTNERVLSAGNYTVADYGTAGQAQVDWQHGLTCSSGQALTTASTSTLACTSTITASDLACSGCVSDAELANNYSGVGACTNQFVRAVNDNAAPTCSAVQLGSDVAGTLPQPNGGTGTGALTCGAAQFLTSNGTAYSCSQGVTGSGANTRVTFWDGTYSLASNAKFIFENERLHVGAAATDTGAVNGYAAGTTQYAVVARNAYTENGGGSIKAMNSSTTGYSGLDLWDDGNTSRQAIVGYGGSAHTTTNKRNAFYVDYGANANGFSVWSGSTLHSRFNSTGLGVGTATPVTKLAVTSSTTVGSASTYGISTGATSSAADLTLGADATYGYIQTWNSKPLYINNQGNNIYTGSGNVGIGTATVPSKLTVAGQVEATTTGFKFPDATTMSTNAGTIYRLITDFTTTSTTFVNVTGLTHAVDAGTAYFFEARLMWQSNNTAGGPGFSVDGPAPLLLSYTVEYQTFANATGGTMTTRHDTAFNAMAALTTTTAAATTYVATIRGVYVVSVSGGTLAVRLRSSNALYTMTAKAGSYLIVRKGFN